MHVHIANKSFLPAGWAGPRICTTEMKYPVVCKLLYVCGMHSFLPLLVTPLSLNPNPRPWPLTSTNLQTFPSFCSDRHTHTHIHQEWKFSISIARSDDGTNFLYEVVTNQGRLKSQRNTRTTVMSSSASEILRNVTALVSMAVVVVGEKMWTKKRKFLLPLWLDLSEGRVKTYADQFSTGRCKLSYLCDAHLAGWRAM